MKLKIDRSHGCRVNSRHPPPPTPFSPVSVILSLGLPIEWRYKRSPGAPGGSLQSTRVLSVSSVPNKAKTPEVSLNEGKQRTRSFTLGIFEKTWMILTLLKKIKNKMDFVLQCSGSSSCMKTWIYWSELPASVELPLEWDICGNICHWEISGLNNLICSYSIWNKEQFDNFGSRSSALNDVLFVSYLMWFMTFSKRSNKYEYSGLWSTTGRVTLTAIVSLYLLFPLLKG